MFLDVSRGGIMEDKQVSLVVLESAMMHLQETNRRLARITICSLILMCIMFGFFVYLFTTFEITTEDVTVDSGNGNANYIGNDGEIINGSGTSEEDNNQKEK